MPQTGTLYVVATPIGNLKDLTFRAIETLKNVSYIACEDTRQTKKLLSRYEIQKQLISYFHPRETQKTPKILKLLKEGCDIALVSDAGTPGISDPGYPLIKQAIDNQIPVVPIPGTSALTTALSASGLPTHRVLFLGFPPPKPASQKKLLASLAVEKGTLVFYLPARKIITFLKLIQETLGERPVVISRELTKIHEEFLRGSPSELLSDLGEKILKGEATVLVGGNPKKKS